MQGDLSAQMVAGIDKFLSRETAASVQARTNYWRRDFTSPELYNASIQTNRQRLKTILGVTDQRQSAKALDLLGNTQLPSKIAETDVFTISRVSWPVLDGFFAEGLWLQPKAGVRARIVALPDADQDPELIAGLAPGLTPERQFARRLAENGCEVLVPVLVNRQDTWSGNPQIRRFTNQPQREWIYRQAYELGRHVIGYEIQEILAAVDFFASRESKGTKIGIAGFNEGGLLALYAAAVEVRIDAALVSGYFDSRQQLWEEPIYRNVFGLLTEFGDAELATLISPRVLVVEHSPIARVDGPPKARDGRNGAAPGKLKTADYESVEREFERARALVKAGGKAFDHFTLISGAEGMTTGPASDRALVALLKGLGIPGEELKRPEKPSTDSTAAIDSAERQRRLVTRMQEFNQKVFRQCEQARHEFFWGPTRTNTLENWESGTAEFKRFFTEQVIGRFSTAPLPRNARSRPLAQKEGEPASSQRWSEYEIVLDVYPDVFAWGYLLVPNDLKANERRPAVVCQHGLEGVPADVVTSNTNSQAFHYYKAFAARLADHGFVVFAPHNPYRGESRFRQLQRKANPLGKSLFSIITAQHQTILEWLSELPFIDAKRIGFYGLSYGGKTAMRVPPVLERYALSICSGDFNEWVEKNVSVDFPGSYMYTGEYEMPEWNLGQTFNYAELAALIAPRPFMVERGHNDGVGVDEWVAYEYAKVRRLYDRLGIPDRTTIEFFNGPHTINGKETFRFLQTHLNWTPP